MSQKRGDFSKCCIYKIEHIEKDNLVYVGQTTNFKLRKSDHKRECNRRSKNAGTKLYKMMRENGGWEMFRMVEIEKYPCNNRQEAERREAEVIQELRASMNTIYFIDEEIKRAVDKTHEEYNQACNSNCFFSCFEDTLQNYIKIQIFNEVQIIKEQYKKIYDECMLELDFMT
jgi:hypothetical protein